MTILSEYVDVAGVEVGDFARMCSLFAANVYIPLHGRRRLSNRRVPFVLGMMKLLPLPLDCIAPSRFFVEVTTLPSIWFPALLLSLPMFY